MAYIESPEREIRQKEYHRVAIEVKNGCRVYSTDTFHISNPGNLAKVPFWRKFGESDAGATSGYTQGGTLARVAVIKLKSLVAEIKGDDTICYRGTDVATKFNMRIESSDDVSNAEWYVKLPGKTTYEPNPIQVGGSVAKGSPFTGSLADVLGGQSDANFDYYSGATFTFRARLNPADAADTSKPFSVTIYKVYADNVYVRDTILGKVEDGGSVQHPVADHNKPGYCYGELDNAFTIFGAKGTTDADLSKPMAATYKNGNGYEGGYTTWGIEMGQEAGGNISWNGLNTVTFNGQAYAVPPTLKGNTTHAYRVVVANRGCYAYTDPQKVHVLPQLTARFRTNTPKDAVCNGDSVSIQIMASIVTAPPTTDFTRFEWKFAAPATSSATDTVWGATVTTTTTEIKNKVTTTAWRIPGTGSDSAYVPIKFRGVKVFGTAPNTRTCASPWAQAVNNVGSSAGLPVVITQTCKKIPKVHPDDHICASPDAEGRLFWEGVFDPGDHILKYKKELGPTSTWDNLDYDANYSNSDFKFEVRHTGGKDTTFFTIHHKSNNGKIMNSIGDYTFQVYTVAGGIENGPSNTLYIEPKPDVAAKFITAPACEGKPINLEVSATADFNGTDLTPTSTFEYEWTTVPAVVKPIAKPQYDSTKAKVLNNATAVYAMNGNGDGHDFVVKITVRTQSGCKATLTVDTSVYVWRRPVVPDDISFVDDTIHVCVGSDTALHLTPVALSTGVSYTYFWHVETTESKPVDHLRGATYTDPSHMTLSSNHPATDLFRVPVNNKSNKMVSTSTAGTYYVYLHIHADSSTGCDSISKVYATHAKVVVEPDPSLTLGGLNELKLCEGDSILLIPSITDIAPADAEITYEWKLVGDSSVQTGSYTKHTGGNDDASFRKKSTLSDNNTQYELTLKIKTKYGCEKTYTRFFPKNSQINVQAKPTVTWDAANVYVYCEGSRLTLKTTSDGATIKWHRMQGTTVTSVQENTSKTYTKNNITRTADSGRYYFVATSSNLCFDTSDIKQVVIYPVPKKPVVDFPDTAFCLNRDPQHEIPSTTSITNASAITDTTYTYKWLLSDKKLNVTSDITHPSNYTADLAHIEVDGSEKDYTSGTVPPSLRIGANSSPDVDTRLPIQKLSTGWITVMGIASLNEHKACADTMLVSKKVKTPNCTDPDIEDVYICPDGTEEYKTEGLKKIKFSSGQPYLSSSSIRIDSVQVFDSLPAPATGHNTWTLLTTFKKPTSFESTGSFDFDLQPYVTAKQMTVPAEDDTLWFKIRVWRKTGMDEATGMYVVLPKPVLNDVTVSLPKGTEYCGGDTIEMVSLPVSVPHTQTTLTYKWQWTPTAPTGDPAISKNTDSMAYVATLDTTDIASGSFDVEVTGTRTTPTLTVTPTSKTCTVKKTATSQTVKVTPLPHITVQRRNNQDVKVCENTDAKMAMVYNSTDWAKATRTVKWEKRQADGTYAFFCDNATSLLPTANAVWNYDNTQCEYTFKPLTKADTGTYRFVVESQATGTTCKAGDTVYIKVDIHANPGLKTTITGDNALCEKETVDLTVKVEDTIVAKADVTSNGNTKIEWWFNADHTNFFTTASNKTSKTGRNYNKSNAAPADSGWYGVKVSYFYTPSGTSLKCQARDSVDTLVHVHALPAEADIHQPNPAPTLCAGHTGGKFTDTVVVPDKNNTYKYFWNWTYEGTNGRDPASATDSNTLSLISPTNKGLATLTVPDEQTAKGKENTLPNISFKLTVVSINQYGCKNAFDKTQNVTVIDCKEPWVDTVKVCSVDTGKSYLKVEGDNSTTFGPWYSMTTTTEPGLDDAGWTLMAAGAMKVTDAAPVFKFEPQPKPLPGQTVYYKAFATYNNLHDTVWLMTKWITWPDAQKAVPTLKVYDENGYASGSGTEKTIFCAGEDFEVVATVDPAAVASPNKYYRWNWKNFYTGNTKTIPMPSPASTGNQTTVNNPLESFTGTWDLTETANFKGVYRLEVIAETEHGCTKLDSASTPELTIHYVPKADITVNPVDVCEFIGTAFNMTYTWNRGVAADYQSISWLKPDSVLIKTGNDKRLVLDGANDVIYANNGKKWMVVVNSRNDEAFKSTSSHTCEGHDTVPVQLTVYPQPVITDSAVALSDDSVCSGTPITMSASYTMIYKAPAPGTPSGTDSIVWIRPEKHPAGPSSADGPNATYTTPGNNNAVDVLDSGLYRMWIYFTDNHGCRATPVSVDTDVVIYRAAEKPEIDVDPESKNICQGATDSMTVKVKDALPKYPNEKYIYIWYEDGAEVYRDTTAADSSRLLFKKDLASGRGVSTTNVFGKVRRYKVEVVAVTAHGCQESVESPEVDGEVVSCDPPKLLDTVICPGEDIAPLTFEYKAPLPFKSISWYVSKDSGATFVPATAGYALKKADGVAIDLTSNIFSSINSGTGYFYPAAADTPGANSAYLFAVLMDEGLGTERRDTAWYSKYKIPVGIRDSISVDIKPDALTGTYCEDLKPQLKANPYFKHSDDSADIASYVYEWKRIKTGGVEDRGTDQEFELRAAGIKQASDSGWYRVKVTPTSVNNCPGEPIYDSIHIKIDLHPKAELEINPHVMSPENKLRAELCANESVDGEVLKLTITTGVIVRWERAVNVDGKTDAQLSWQTWVPQNEATMTRTETAPDTIFELTLGGNDVVRPVLYRQNDTVNYFRAIVKNGPCEYDTNPMVSLKFNHLPDLDRGLMTSDEPDGSGGYLYEACKDLELTVIPKDSKGNNFPESDIAKKYWQQYDFSTKKWTTLEDDKQLTLKIEVPAGAEPDTHAYRMWLKATGDCADTVFSDSVQVHVYPPTKAGTLTVDTTQPLCYLGNDSSFKPTAKVTGHVGKITKWIITNKYKTSLSDTITPGNPDSIYQFDWSVLNNLLVNDGTRRDTLEVKAVVKNEGGCDEAVAVPKEVVVYMPVPKTTVNYATDLGVKDTVCDLEAAYEFVPELNNGTSFNTGYESVVWEFSSRLDDSGVVTDTIISASAKIAAKSSMLEDIMRLVDEKLNPRAGSSKALLPKYEDDTTYYVRVKGSNYYCPDSNSSTIKSITVVRAPKEPKGLEATTPVCEGSDIILRANRPAKSALVWYDETDGDKNKLLSGNGFNASTGKDTIKLSGYKAGTYKFRAYDTVKASCSPNEAGSDQITVVVEENPVAGKIAVNAGHQICSSKALIDTAKGFRPKTAQLIFEWYTDTVAKPLSAVKEITKTGPDSIASWTPTGITTTTVYYTRYKVHTEHCGDVYSPWDTVTVFVAPEVNNEGPATQHICEGDTAKIGFTASKAGYKYIVYEVDASGTTTGGVPVDSGVTTAGPDSARFVPTHTSTKYYYVELTDTVNKTDCNRGTSSTVEVQVEPRPVGGKLTIDPAADPKKYHELNAGTQADLTLTGYKGIRWNVQHITEKNDGIAGINPASKFDTIRPNASTPASGDIQWPQNFPPTYMDTTYIRVEISGNVCPPAYSDTVKISVKSSDKPILTPEKHTICISDTPRLEITIPDLYGNASTTPFAWENGIKIERLDPGSTTWKDVKVMPSGKDKFSFTDTTAVDTVALTRAGTYKYRLITFKAGNVIAMPQEYDMAETQITVDTFAVAGTLSPKLDYVCETSPDTLILLGSKGTFEKLQFAKSDTTRQGTGWEARTSRISYPNRETDFYHTLTTEKQKDSGWFRAIVSNGVCPNDTSNYALINIVKGPKAGKVTVKDTLCYDQEGKGYATLTDNTSDSIWWQYSTTTKPVAYTYSTDSINKTKYGITGSFTDRVDIRAVVWDRSGVCEADTSTVGSILLYDSIKITSQPEDAVVVGEGNAKFGVSAGTGGRTYADGNANEPNDPAHGATYTYQWRYREWDGAADDWGAWRDIVDNTATGVSGATTDSLKLDNVVANDWCGKQFRCIVTDHPHCDERVISDPAELICYDMLTPGFTESMTRGTCYYEGDSAFYYVEGASGEGNLHYIWEVAREGTWYRIPEEGSSDPLPASIPALAGHYLLGKPDSNYITFDNITRLMNSPLEIDSVRGLVYDDITAPENALVSQGVSVKLCKHPRPEFEYIIDTAVICSLYPDSLEFKVQTIGDLNDGYTFDYVYLYTFDDLGPDDDWSGADTLKVFKKMKDTATVSSSPLYPTWPDVLTVVSDSNIMRFKAQIPAEADNIHIRAEVYSNFTVGTDTILYTTLRIDQPLVRTKEALDTNVCTGNDFGFFTEFERGNPNFKSDVTAQWWYEGSTKLLKTVRGTDTLDDGNDPVFTHTLEATNAKYDDHDSIYYLYAWTEYCQVYDTMRDTVKVHVLDGISLDKMTMAYSEDPLRGDSCAWFTKDALQNVVLTAYVTEKGEHPAAYYLTWLKSEDGGNTWDTVRPAHDIVVFSSANGVPNDRLTLNYKLPQQAGTYKVVLTVESPCPDPQEIDTDVIFFVTPEISQTVDPSAKTNWMTPLFKNNQGTATVNEKTVAEMGYNDLYIYLDPEKEYSWWFRDPVNYDSLNHNGTFNDLVDTLIIGSYHDKVLKIRGVLDYTDTTFYAERRGIYGCDVARTQIDTLDVVDRLMIIDTAWTGDTVLCSDVADSKWEITVTTNIRAAWGARWDYLDLDGTVHEVPLPDYDGYFDSTIVETPGGVYYTLTVTNPQVYMDGWNFRLTVWDDKDIDSTYGDAPFATDFILHVSDPFYFTCLHDPVLEKNHEVVFNQGPGETLDIFKYLGCTPKAPTPLDWDGHEDSLTFTWFVLDTAGGNTTVLDTVQVDKENTSVYTFNGADDGEGAKRHPGKYWVYLEGRNICGSQRVGDSVRVIPPIVPDSIYAEEHPVDPDPGPDPDNPLPPRPLPDSILHTFGPQIDSLPVTVCEGNEAVLYAPYKGGPADSTYWQYTLGDTTASGDTIWLSVDVESDSTIYRVSADGDSLYIFPVSTELEGLRYRRVLVAPDSLGVFYTGTFIMHINYEPDISFLHVYIESRTYTTKTGAALDAAEPMSDGEAWQNDKVWVYLGDADGYDESTVPITFPGPYDIFHSPEIEPKPYKLEYYKIFHGDTSLLGTVTPGSELYIEMDPVTEEEHDSTQYFVRIYNDCGFSYSDTNTLRIYDSLLVQWIPDTIMKYPGDDEWEEIEKNLGKTLEPGQLLVTTIPGEPEYTAWIVLCDVDRQDDNYESVSDTATRGFMVAYVGGVTEDGKYGHFIYRNPNSLINPDEWIEVHDGDPIASAPTNMDIFEREGHLMIRPNMRVDGIIVRGVGANNHLNDSTVELRLIVVPSVHANTLRLNGRRKYTRVFCDEIDSIGKIPLRLSSTEYTDAELRQYEAAELLHFEWFRRDNGGEWEEVDEDEIDDFTHIIDTLRYPEERHVEFMVMGISNCQSDTVYAEFIIKPALHPQLKVEGDWIVCEGEGVTLTATDSAAGDHPVYTWWFDNQVVLDEDSNRYRGQTLALGTELAPGPHTVIVWLEVDSTEDYCFVETRKVFDSVIYVLRSLSKGDMVLEPSGYNFCAEGEGFFALTGRNDSVNLKGFDITWYMTGVDSEDWMSVPDSLITDSIYGLSMRTGWLTTPGTYQVMAVAWAECGTDTVTGVIEIEPAIRPDVELLQNDTLCFYDNMPVFTAVPDSVLPATAKLTYIWWFNNGPGMPNLGSSYTPSWSDIDTAGTYPVVVELIVENAAGYCIVPRNAFDTAYLTVRPLPQPQATADKYLIKSVETAEVCVESLDGEPFATVRWDCATASVENPDSVCTMTIAPINPGAHTFCATVTNIYGCEDSSCVTVLVQSNFTLDSLSAVVIIPPVLPIDDGELPGYPDDPYNVDPQDPHHYFPDNVIPPDGYVGPVWYWHGDTAELWICPHNTAMFKPLTSGGENPWYYTWEILDGNAEMAWPRELIEGVPYEVDTTRNPQDSVFGIFFPDSSTRHIRMTVRDGSVNPAEFTILILVHYYHPEEFYLEVQPKVTHQRYYVGQGVNLQAKPDRHWWITWIETVDGSVADSFSTWRTTQQHLFTETRSERTSFWITTVDRWGCRIWDSIAVKVIPPPNVLLLDDPYESVIFPEFEVEITNMWGRPVKLFNQRNANGDSKGWDGRTPSGERVQAGTYYYRVKIPTLISEGDHSGYYMLTGAVTVLDNVTRH